MKTKIPEDATKPLWQFAKQLSDELDNELNKRTPDLNGRSNLLLTAPDGSIWAVTVDNAGTLATTKVYG